MAKTKLAGGCQCGAARYSIDAPAIETAHCWCGMCRKIHGAIMVTFSIFPKDKFTLEKGGDDLGCYRSSPPARRYFCKNCGCPLYILSDNHPDIVELATGTLDGGAHPGHPDGKLCHMWVGSKVSWHPITDDLPQYEKSTPED